ncbi:hypothetical protein DITRI_Ditri07aG0058700 [Diplodiscus trichospermus]
MGSRKCMTTLLTSLALVGMMMLGRVASQNYGDALSKCILFFEGQRSGKLLSNQRVHWRKDSAFSDGSDVGMDLAGGYYDAGDNVKFNFPMAFSTTLLAWSVIEFGQSMGPDLQYALDSVRWGTDYLLKATKIPGTVTAAVGDPNGDHNCWQRPEDMDTPRTSYVVNQTHPGSEVSAEIAAALAAASLAFNSTDKNYSTLLLSRAKEVFEFADKFRGNYKDSVGGGVCPFYCDFDGYMDELIWGAAWLLKVTNEQMYWDYIQKNMPHLPKQVLRHVDGGLQAVDTFSEFGWDAKYAVGNELQQFRPLCYPSGEIRVQSVAGITYHICYILSRLEQIAKGQVDYILGKNPLGMSYMVGYGQTFPQRIHHRASSLPSIDEHPQHIKCKDGTPYFLTNNPNPNLLTGAIVGGPDAKDQFPDNRTDAPQSEPTTYINAPFVGALAYFKALSEL